MEHSPHIEDHAQKELAKLNKFLQPNDATVYIDLVMDVEGVDHRLYNVELRVHDKHGELVAHETGRDIYLAITHVADKMGHELDKSKEKRLDKRDKPDGNDPIRKDKLDFEK
jgi:ribosomal subunit interface protein